MVNTTLRLPDGMARAVKSAAAEKGTTVNDLVRSLIADFLRAEQERMLYDGFSRLGADPQECDVEFAIHAACEVVLGSE